MPTARSFSPIFVRGLMHYYAERPFPKLVHVKGLEIHPCDDGLPSLAGLRGLAPGCTGERTAVAFVRLLCNDERRLRRYRSKQTANVVERLTRKVAESPLKNPGC